MTTKLAIALTLVALLCGCDSRSETDQCLRADLFNQCVQALPRTSGNTGDAVRVCMVASDYQALRQIKFIKPECRP
jgi:ABC-type uncharacterized transport system auxiliary subunit